MIVAEVCNILTIASVNTISKLKHPLSWSYSKNASQVQINGKIALMLDDCLYFSIGWISSAIAPTSIPVAQSISVEGVDFSSPSILSIESNPITQVELIAKYSKSITTD